MRDEIPSTQSPPAIEPFLLACPACGRVTDRLKQFRQLRWLVFLGHFHWHQTEFVRACPPCMRTRAWWRCLANIPTAHIIWPLVVLPMAIVTTVRSFQPGHSAEILEGKTPEYLAYLENKSPELSWHRLMAVVALITCWLPLFGLLLSWWAWWLNRGYIGWRRMVSGISLIIAILLHMLIAGLALYELITK